MEHCRNNGSRSIVWEIGKSVKDITWKKRAYYIQIGCFRMEQSMNSYTTRKRSPFTDKPIVAVNRLNGYIHQQAKQWINPEECITFLTTDTDEL